jgi:hypothetical protein
VLYGINGEGTCYETAGPEGNAQQRAPLVLREPSKREHSAGEPSMLEQCAAGAGTRRAAMQRSGTGNTERVQRFEVGARGRDAAHVRATCRPRSSATDKRWQPALVTRGRAVV